MFDKCLILWEQLKRSMGGSMDHIAQFRVLNPHQYKHCLENCSKRTILDTLNIRTEHLSKL